MPTRSLTTIRKDITRLAALIEREKAAHPVLVAMAPVIAGHAAALDEASRTVTEISVRAARERDERTDAVDLLYRWVRTWRPAVLVLVPGAAKSLLELPTASGSPDDILRVAQDLHAFLLRDPAAEPLRAAAIAELGHQLGLTETEISEATRALADEAAARERQTRLATAANEALVHTLAIVRTLFGATSPQYKQFIPNSPAGADDEDDDEVPAPVVASAE